MNLGLGDVIIIVIFPLFGAFIAFIVFGVMQSDYTIRNTIIAYFVGVILCIIALSWYNTNTADGARRIKDFKSELQNGLDREIIIYSEDGRKIYSYEGKFDLKVNEDSRDLEFIDNEGKKQIVIFGIKDTAIIKEK